MLDFNEIIDDGLTKEHKPLEVGIYYPSTIGGCLRKNYYNFVLPPKPTPKDKQRIFAIGNLFHWFITDILRRSPRFKHVNSERSVTIPYDDLESHFVLHGRADDIVVGEENGEKFVIEVKSAKFPPKIPQTAHILQLQFYLRAFNCQKGYLLYVQKDNGNLAFFEIRYDQPTYYEVINRSKTLHKCLLGKKLPEPEGRTSSWECNYCDWKEECWKETPPTKKKPPAVNLLKPPAEEVPEAL